MPGLFSRIKTWSSLEDVIYSDLNAEFDNVITNFVPLMIDDYSTNVSQMQTVSDPGEVGTESLATTLAGEIARLRNMIKEITGEDQWYETPVASLTGLSSAVGTTGFTANRLVSGRVRTDSDQPIFLVPNGAARTVKLDGTPTNFKYYVESVEYTISSDVTLTNLTAAPSSNNTTLINDTNAADQEWTKYAGENGSEITVDTMGTEIQALVGKLAAFSLNNGTTTEMFLARVKSTTALTDARRGYFFDSSDAPQARIVFSNNDTITLLKLGWIFAKTDGTLTVTYTNPVWDYDEPSSPATNDYWFDFTNNKWRKYDVASFIDADATLVGVCCQDTTNCIGARSYEFFKNWSDLNTIEIFLEGNAQIKSRFSGGTVSSWGNIYSNERSLWEWNMSGDLDTGAEAASTRYFAYITEDGDVKLSVTGPYDRQEDLRGYYHPHHSWRCVGSVYNNGSSNFASVESYFRHYEAVTMLPTQTAARNIEVVDQFVPLDSSGGAFTQYLPSAVYCRGQAITFMKTTTDVNAITLDGFGSETINGATTLKLVVQYQFYTLCSDGSNWLIVNKGMPLNSQQSYNGYAGLSANNTTCGYFTNRHNNTGYAISQVTNDATDGLDLLINVDGIYSFDGALPHVAAQNSDFGITRNATGAELDGSPNALAWGTKRLSTSNQRQVAGATPAVHISGTVPLNLGDHIRFQEGGITVGTADYGYFNLVLVGMV